MWGTFILDVYKQDEAVGLRDALEEVLGPESGSGWSTGGVYVFWNPVTRQVLYVGIAGDLPLRFAQHNGLRSCPATGCKREQVASHFADHDELGYTILPLSSLSQPSTARQRAVLSLQDRELIDLNEALSVEVVDQLRALEGLLIALAKARCGEIPPWNSAVGRLPREPPDARDGTLDLAVGAIDTLLQARKTIRELAENNLWALFEVQLHGARISAVQRVVAQGWGSPDEMVREELDRWWIHDGIREEIKRTGYLDERCRVTVVPS